MKSTLLAVLLALCCAGASAQMIYTTVSLDGHKTFSDRADTMPETVPEAAAPSDMPKAPGRKPLVSQRLSATVNVQEAERRLAQARQKRSLGMAPLPGESVKVPGGILVNARYWNRQEKRRIEVEQAQRRLNHLLRPQLARQ
jgi:hypothetical protein